MRAPEVEWVLRAGWHVAVAGIAETPSVAEDVERPGVRLIAASSGSVGVGR